MNHFQVLNAQIPVLTELVFCFLLKYIKTSIKLSYGMHCVLSESTATEMCGLK